MVGLALFRRNERRGRVCLGREERASAGGGRSLQTAGGEFNHGLHLFTVKPIERAHNVVEVGARLEVLENRGYRHACATAAPIVAPSFLRVISPPDGNQVWVWLVGGDRVSDVPRGRGEIYI